mgnify:CR=1 FL=1
MSAPKHATLYRMVMPGHTCPYGLKSLDLLEAMRQDGAAEPSALRVDGGMVENNWVMQFLADILGVYDVYGGNHEAAIRQGAQIPVSDPLLSAKDAAAPFLDAVAPERLPVYAGTVE